MEKPLRMISVRTKKERVVIDITGQINELLQGQKLEKSICHLFVKSTNAALTTTFLNPEADLAVASVFEIVTPELATSDAQESYHRHITPISPSVVASFLGPFLSLPVENNQLILGEGQSVVLVELAGPREHEIIVNVE